MSVNSEKESKPKLDQNQNPLIKNEMIDDDDKKDVETINKNDNIYGKNSFNDTIHALNLWIWQCQTWIYFHEACQSRIQQQQQNFLNTNNNNINNDNQQTSASTNRNISNQGLIVKLSSIRKRLLASMIDYFFINFLYDQFRVLIADLFDLDISFTTMDFKELETFFPDDNDNIDDLLPKIFWFYIKSIQYSTMFYLFDLIYETLFLYGWPNRTYPGATIGKRIMGLRVICCDNEHIEQLSIEQPTIVRVQQSSSGNLTLLKSFMRTLIKLLPINNTIQCIYIITSRYNRSYFDKRMKLLVIDVSQPAMAQVLSVQQNLQLQQQQQQQQPYN